MSQLLKMFLAAFAVCLGIGGAQPAIAQQKIESSKGDPQQIEHGRYVVKIGGCNDCHTTGYATTGGKIPESQWLMGDKVGWRGEWGTTYPTNLRLFINSLTQDQWMQVAKNAQTRPPMPWWILHDMNEQDLKALYAYVKWLGPAGEAAPNSVSPDVEPVGPVVQFPVPPKTQRSPLGSAAK
jgi:mono/diheme cytochrome c family protein